MKPLIIYYNPGCTSSRRAKSWMEEQKIPFSLRNTSQFPLKSEEIKHILFHLPNGLDDLLSVRSAIFKNLECSIEDLSLNELLQLMEKHPKLVRHPIIMHNNKVVIGFNTEMIRTFIPRDRRISERKKILYCSALHPEKGLSTERYQII